MYKKPHVHTKGDSRNVEEKKGSDLNDEIILKSIWSIYIYSRADFYGAMARVFSFVTK